MSKNLIPKMMHKNNKEQVNHPLNTLALHLFFPLHPGQMLKTLNSSTESLVVSKFFFLAEIY